MRRSPEILIAGMLLTGLCGCAVPVAPSGGPPDREPPVVVEMSPSNNAVNFTGNTVAFLFNEHVDEGSFQQALEITPEPVRPPRINWSGKRVEIRFAEPLSENTTYIFTIGTRLRDLRSVSLKAPITRAVSTGPEINRGRISGRIVDPIDGSGKAGLQVFAYATSDTIGTGTLPERPLYRTETDASGNFEFGYLSSRPYFVLGVSDRNSNRRPDMLETIAVAPSLKLDADTSGVRIETPWYAAVFDTVGPDVRRIQPLSASRVMLRYGEDVYFDEAGTRDWSISDSSGARFGTARSLYRPHDDRRSIVVVTNPLPGGRYEITPGVVSDSAANRASRTPLAFVSPGRPDTAATRLETFLPISDEDMIRLQPGALAGFKLSVPTDSSETALRLRVADTTGGPLDFTLRSVNHVDYFVDVPAAEDGRPFVLSWTSGVESDSVISEQRFRKLTDRDFGGISGIVVDFPDSTRVVIDAFRRPDRIARSTSTASRDGRFQHSLLEPGSYRLRLFRDDNLNGRWDAGGISPYRSPEIIYWAPDSVRVRARWETEMDTLRIEAFMRD